jgi:hypothetical protein
VMYLVFKSYARFLAAVVRRGTVRFYVGNPRGFYTALAADDIAYVVLRWSEDLPFGAAAEKTRTDDIDHLVADRDVRRVLKVAAKFPGRLKADFYSQGGASGSSYAGMPYYPPYVARQILDGRISDARGFSRPKPLHEFLAFAYHLVYHKGLASGIALGLPSAPEPHASKKDYAAELRRLAIVANVTLPEDLTLLELHKLLKIEGWAMPSDLMVRWTKPHPALLKILDDERSLIEAVISAAQGYTIFVLREDCDSEDLQKIVLSMIAERFDILSLVRLDERSAGRIISTTRGGAWTEKYINRVVAPTVAIICKDAESPGPLPVNMSRKKIAKRYPHLDNTDVLIKRNIRASVNAAAPSPKNRAVIHATDNAFEAAQVLVALFGDRAVEEMQKVKALGRAQD